MTMDYKAMWEELKKSIEESKANYKKEEEDYRTHRYYHSAIMAKYAQKEDAIILHKMKNIEKEQSND